MNKKFIIYTLLFSIIFSLNVFAYPECYNDNVVKYNDNRRIWQFLENIECPNNPVYFRGASYGEDLYTAGYVSGRSIYDISIENTHYQKLSAEIRIINENFIGSKIIEIPEFFGIYKTTLNVSPGDRISLVFYGKSEFNGYIKPIE